MEGSFKCKIKSFKYLTFHFSFSLAVMRGRQICVFIVFFFAKSLQLCPTLCDPIDGTPPGSPSPWDSPGKNTGVGCHFLLQCIKVKSESEVAQLNPTLSDPMDCSLPGSSVHGIFQARVLYSLFGRCSLNVCNMPGSRSCARYRWFSSGQATVVSP